MSLEPDRRSRAPRRGTRATATGRATGARPLFARPALLLAALICQASPAAAGCLSPGAPLPGILQRLESRHPNGTPLRALVLLTPPGTCLLLDSGDGPEEVEIRILHLVFPDRQRTQAAARLLGEPVTIGGQDIARAFTAWHLGDAVLFDPRILP